MAGDNEKLVQEYQQMSKRAFVLGYTGEIGKELVRVLLSSQIFAKVVLIGRRTVTYEDELYKDVVSVHYINTYMLMHIYVVYLSEFEVVVLVVDKTTGVT